MDQNIEYHPTQWLEREILTEQCVGLLYNIYIYKKYKKYLQMLSVQKSIIRSHRNKITMIMIKFYNCPIHKFESATLLATQRLLTQRYVLQRPLHDITTDIQATST